MAVAETKGKFKIDFSDIPDNALPEGEYTATINKVELKEGTKAPYLNWEFDILDEAQLGRKVWMITSLADAALFRLKQVAEALGFEGDFDFEIDENNMVVDPELAGTEVRIQTEVRTYEGQKRSGVKSILDYYTSHHLGLEDGDDDEDDFEDVDEFDDTEDMEDEDDFDGEEEEVVPEPAPAPKARRSKK